MAEFYNYIKECPDCKGVTRVVDCRERPNGSIMRRRECTVCGFRYNTIEIEECMTDDKVRIEIRRLKDHIERLENHIRRIRDAVDSEEVGT